MKRPAAWRPAARRPAPVLGERLRVHVTAPVKKCVSHFGLPNEKSLPECLLQVDTPNDMLPEFYDGVTSTALFKVFGTLNIPPSAPWLFVWLVYLGQGVPDILILLELDNSFTA